LITIVISAACVSVFEGAQSNIDADDGHTRRKMSQKGEVSMKSLKLLAAVITISSTCSFGATYDVFKCSETIDMNQSNHHSAAHQEVIGIRTRIPNDAFDVRVYKVEFAPNLELVDSTSRTQITSKFLVQYFIYEKLKTDGSIDSASLKVCAADIFGSYSSGDRDYAFPLRPSLCGPVPSDPIPPMDTIPLRIINQVAVFDPATTLAGGYNSDPDNFKVSANCNFKATIIPN